MKVPFRRLAAGLVLLGLGCGVAQSLLADSETGVLVLCPDGPRSWEKNVLKTVRQSDLPYPTRLYFGVGNSREQVDDLQDAVNTLEDHGAHTIYAVPLVLSSYAPALRQWKYLLGAGVQPGYINTPFFPLTHSADIHFSDPLGGDPIVGEIILEHVQDMSQAPPQESVFIVAEGPSDESDNKDWLSTLTGIGAQVQQRGRFKDVTAVTLRDEGPDAIRAQAIQALRQRVMRADHEGEHVLVVPLVLEPAGIGNNVDLALKGLDFAFDAKPLLPDQRIAQWIRSKAP